MRKLIILLPAYNEAASLESLLMKINAAGRELNMPLLIIVGNDGSRDATGAIVEKLQAIMPLEEIRHAINRGLGETARDLFERAAEIADDDDIIVRMDADDTHEPRNIERLIAKLDAGYDVVIASRFQPGGDQMGVSAYRAFISRCANIFMGLFFNMRGVRDYSCGYRAYRASIIKRAIASYGNNFIQLKGLGFTCTLEKLVKLEMLGARMTEAPFVHRYDQKISSSKMISSLTTLGYIVMTIMCYWPGSGWRWQYKHLRTSGAALAEAQGDQKTTAESRLVASQQD